MIESETLIKLLFLMCIYASLATYYLFREYLIRIYYEFLLEEKHRVPFEHVKHKTVFGIRKVLINTIKRAGY